MAKKQCRICKDKVHELFEFYSEKAKETIHICHECKVMIWCFQKLEEERKAKVA